MDFKQKQKKETISSHVSLEIIEFLDYLSAVHGISRSAVVEQILEDTRSRLGRKTDFKERGD